MNTKLYTRKCIYDIYLAIYRKPIQKRKLT